MSAAKSEQRGGHVNFTAYLRIRPLDQKHRLKLKSDYYHNYPDGLPKELHKNQDIPRTITEWPKNVLAVQGHPLAGGNHMTQRDKDKFKQSYYTFDHVFHSETTNVSQVQYFNNIDLAHILQRVHS